MVKIIVFLEFLFKKIVLYSIKWQKRTKRINNKTKRRKTRRIRKKMRGGAAASTIAGTDWERFFTKLKYIMELVAAGTETDQMIKEQFAELLRDHRDYCQSLQNALNKIANDLMSKELEDFFK
tara:strand:- start:336 stop:704 length:369 start_codon:yes stop_codon:yes gene_type:complete